MCKSVVHKYISRKRKYLGFILKPTERSRENEAIVVPLKVGSVVLPVMVFLHPEALIG
jgi:hypothetical protein